MLFKDILVLSTGIFLFFSVIDKQREFI